MVKSQPFLTDNDLQKLLSCKLKCHPSQRITFNIIIQLLWDSGARISEICNLTVQDFDYEEKFIILRNTKNKQDRIIPVTGNIAESIKKLVGRRKQGYIFRGRGNNPISRISVYQALQRRVTASGINKHIRPHTFRHHLITDKLNKNVPLPLVQKYVGHTSMSSTSLYYHYTQDDLKKVLEA